MKINGKEVHFITTSGVDIAQAMNSDLFLNWVSNLDPKFTVNVIDFQSVDMARDRVIFLKMKSDIEDEDGNKVPGVCFLRGGSVAILTILKEEDTLKEYVVLTSQCRVPSGEYESLSLPAGMLDGNNDLSNVAIEELYEETGIPINDVQVVNLSAKFDGTVNRGIALSTGGCDEHVHIFSVEVNVSSAVIEHLQGKVTGNKSESERIKVVIVPKNEVLNTTNDAKAFIAMSLYNSSVISNPIDEFSIEQDLSSVGC